MARDLCGVGRAEIAQVFLQPKIAGFRGMIESKLLEIPCCLHRTGGPVKDTDCLRTICQWTHPYFNRAFGAEAIPLPSGTVLVDRDDVLVSKQLDGLRSHGCQIVSGKQ